MKSEIDFHQWCVCLPRWILDSRTKFSWFLLKSFRVLRRNHCDVPTTAFPLPAPFCGLFAGGGPGLSKARMKRLAKARVLHILVMALNYLFLGRFPSDFEIGRQPGKIHFDIYDRLRSFLAVCGSSGEKFPYTSGRSGPQLASCLMQLENFILGCSEFKDPYHRATDETAYCEDPDLLDPNEFPSLVPYRSLDASRIKLFGKGQWQLDEFLHSSLWLPYVEPKFLLHGKPFDRKLLPSFKYEDKEECLKLAKIWDINGLLSLFERPLQPGYFSRVFQVFKSADRDRQIGDRRLPNLHEYHINGPSKDLPPGHLLCQLHLPPGQKLRASVTDRRDFYHQAKVSPQRALTNLLPFSYPLSDFIGTSAYDLFQASRRGGKSRSRADRGDGFGKGASDACQALQEASEVFPGFSSLFQGDHLGVEFALAAHEGLLKDAACLEDDRRLRGHFRVPFGPVWSGLIIDDFFTVSAEPRGFDKEQTEAYSSLVKARSVYEAYGIEGSSEKDIVAEDLFKAAGAEVNSTDVALDAGVCLVGSPISKRFALSALSLRAARLPSITPRLAARLAGNWVSVSLFRRCVTAVVDDFFALGSGLEKPGAPAIVPLSRKVAQELVLLASLAPLISSNIQVDYAPEIYASDSSSKKGAYVKGRVSEGVSKALWIGNDKRGCYTRLDRPVQAFLRTEFGDEDFGDGEEEVYDHFPSGYVAGVAKSPLLRFDFVEICGGAGVISKAALSLGLVVAPVLDLSESVWYDLRGLRFLEWILHMIVEGRFASFVVEPPCTSFSCAAYPPVRSYKQPLGFNRLEPKTLHGNTLAFRTFIILKTGQRHKRPNGMEQPRRSKMCWTSFWISLRESGYVENVIAACQFGSIHKKEFVFLLYLVENLQVKCPGGHPHVRVEGSHTKNSAIYPDDLGMHVALGFRAALEKQRRLENLEADICGGESLLANDVLLTQPWRHGRCWRWKKQSHINVLETYSSVVALGDHGLSHPDSRVNFLVDSQVARGALSKGRSSSYALQPSLKRSCAIQLGFGIYPSWSFSPTRLNPSDDPTRDVEIRAPSGLSFSEALSDETLADIHGLGLKRFAANWLRLFILLSYVKPSSAGPSCAFGFSSVDGLLTFPQHSAFDPWNSLFQSSPAYLHPSQVVVGLLIGFSFALFFAPISSLGSSNPFSALSFGFSWILLVSPAAAMEPTSAAERERAFLRRALSLPADRVVRRQTRDKRMQLFGKFRSWLWKNHQVSLRGLLEKKPVDAEMISYWLVTFGRELFAAGKSYGQFSETINSIAMLKPLIKRQLTPAWDLAFAWLADEPHQHHPALPVSILLAMLTICLCWGWTAEAGVLALAWCGLCRVGEVLQAVRADLILPQDSAPGNRFVLLRILDPKTRGRSARHQSARVDHSDIVELLSKVFGNLHDSDHLWPFSASTLRKRFNCLLTTLGLPTSKGHLGRPFDLASLRPGGATWLLNCSENSELVRRRGRWLSHRVMEIYLQEVHVATYLQRLTEEQRRLILELSLRFETTFQTACDFLAHGIPSKAWYFLFRDSAHSAVGREGFGGIFQQPFYAAHATKHDDETS